MSALGLRASARAQDGGDGPKKAVAYRKAQSPALPTTMNGATLRSKGASMLLEAAGNVAVQMGDPWYLSNTAPGARNASTPSNPSKGNVDLLDL